MGIRYEKNEQKKFKVLCNVNLTSVVEIHYEKMDHVLPATHKKGLRCLAENL